jgi:hypothetical protein
MFLQFLILLKKKQEDCGSGIYRTEGGGSGSGSGSGGGGGGAGENGGRML